MALTSNCIFLKDKHRRTNDSVNKYEIIVFLLAELKELLKYTNMRVKKLYTKMIFSHLFDRFTTQFILDE